MLKIFPLLMLVPSLVFADALDKDWNLTVTTTGSIAHEKAFESKGEANFNRLNTMTGYNYSYYYRAFNNKKDQNITYGVWQEAEAFRAYLKDCNFDVPTDLIAMRIGMDKIFNSKNDDEVKNIVEELGPKLNFEQKIEFAAQLGGMLLEGYDYDRADAGLNSEGVVTLRDMIEARQKGSFAGVCRDMSMAMAHTLKAMGVKDAYVVGYQSAVGGHATVLVQDPDNKNKTYNINYNYTTSNESASTLSHLNQNSTLPSVGTNMQIYDADGKHLTSLPTHLGVLLHEMAGGKASDLDPMLRSENSLGSVVLGHKSGASASLNAGITPDGDQVMALSGVYESGHEIAPSKAGVVLYNNRKDTNNYGQLDANGAYFEVEQKVQTRPLKIKSDKGEVSMQVYGKINSQYNVTYSKADGLTDGELSSYGAMLLSTGTEINYKTKNENTKVRATLAATGDLAKSDVRDEGTNYTPDLRDVTGTLAVTHRISSHLEGYGGVAVTARPEFGVQSRQELGIVKQSESSRMSFIVGHQGQVAGSAPVFIPGSQNNYFLEASYGNKKGWSASLGGQCTVNNKKDCGVRATVTYKH
ncbi:hypothetical protein [Peredibacter starrii]|uniref:Uncharacterized protein n=1 Tax=Peredibacter starrii TaxID=28202 RepID=A0AAX4HTP7_9BACT|nr:hypothetical protein [Peredibacter starrii]WPU66754.1 hypothetical protein SOO65_08340 [Peredibacter starrii]